MLQAEPLTMQQNQLTLWPQLALQKVPQFAPLIVLQFVLSPKQQYQL